MRILRSAVAVLAAGVAVAVAGPAGAADSADVVFVTLCTMAFPSVVDE